MKLFGFLATLGVLGCATAGPVQLNSATSECDIQCSTATLTKINFVRGQTYSYRFSTVMETSVSQEFENKTTLSLTGGITLYAIDTCRVALKIQSMYIGETGVDGSTRTSKGHEELRDMLLESPLIFNYEEGLVTRLCPAKNESPFALNIKRGILSLFQNGVPRLLNEGIITEVDVNGACQTTFRDSEPSYTGRVVVTKEKKLSKCEKPARSEPWMALLPLQWEVQSSSIVNGSQICEQTIRDGSLEEVMCIESHDVRPFKRDGGALTAVRTTLSAEPQVARGVGLSFDYEESHKTKTIVFEHPEEAELDGADLERRVLDEIRKERNGPSDDFQQDQKIIRLLRQMKYQSLKAFIMENRDAMLLDLLMSTITKDAIKVTTDLIKTGQIGSDSAKFWLMRVSLTTNLDLSVLKHMQMLLDEPELAMEARLAISSMCRTHRHNNRDLHDADAGFHQRLVDEIKEGRPELAIPAIRAIGNLRRSVFYTEEYGTDELIAGIATNGTKPSEQRNAAIESLYRISSPEMTAVLTRIIENIHEVVDVRIAAYLAWMRTSGSSDPDVRTIEKLLKIERPDSQFGFFLYSHLKNSAEKSQTGVADILESEELKRFDSSDSQFSNYHYEKFFDPLDAGFEVRANSIVSSGAQRHTLDATFDVFGVRMNVLDASVKAQRDLSRAQGFVRVLGREILYKDFEGTRNSEMDKLMRIVMSPEGLKFSRSMSVLDTKIVLPLGNGLPFTVTVDAVSKLSMDVKAHNNELKRNDWVTQIRASPDAKMEVSVRMTVSTPKTESGIKFVTSARSGWTIDSELKVDLTAPSAMKLSIKAPRKKTDLLVVESVAHILTNGEEFPVTRDPDSWKACTEDSVNKVLGHSACVQLEWPRSDKSQLPVWIMLSKSRFAIQLFKTDPSLKEFVVESSIVHKRGIVDEALFRIDTPGSEVDRQFKGRLYHQLDQQRFGVEFYTPMKKASIEGQYKGGDARSVEVAVNVDGETKMSLRASSAVKNGKSPIHMPTIEIMMGKEQILSARSQLALLGASGSANVEIESILNRNDPWEMDVKFSYGDSKNRRGSLRIASRAFRANFNTTMKQDDGRMDFNAEGHYVLQAGVERSFDLTKKFSNTNGRLRAESELKIDGHRLISTRGELSQSNPALLEMSVDLIDKHYGLRLKHEQTKEDQAISASAENGSERYQASLRYMLSLQKPKFDFKIGGPDGVERIVRFSFSQGGENFRLNAESNLTDSSYSMKLNYIPSGYVHNVFGQLAIDGDNIKCVASLDMTRNLQSKLQLLRNSREIVLATAAVAGDVRKPNMKISVAHRNNLVFGVSAEGVFETDAGSLLFSMQAPRKISGNTAWSTSGSMRDGLESKFDLKAWSDDKWIDLDLTSGLVIKSEGGGKSVLAHASQKLWGEMYTQKMETRFSWQSLVIRLNSNAPGYVQNEFSLDANRSRIGRVSKIWGQTSMRVALMGTNLIVDPIKLEAEVTNDDRAYKMVSTIRGGRNQERKMMGMIVTLDKELRAYEASLEVPNSDVYSIKADVRGHSLRDGIKGTSELRWKNVSLLVSAEMKVQRENPIFAIQMKSAPEGRVLLALDARKDKRGASIELRGDSGFRISNRATVKEYGFSLAATLEPKITLISKCRPAGEPENLLEVSIESGVKPTLLGRLSVPKLGHTEPMVMSGTLERAIDGMISKGGLKVKYQGAERASLLFEISGPNGDKKFIGSMRHTLNPTSTEYKISTTLKGQTVLASDFKMDLQKDEESFLSASSELFLEDLWNSSSIMLLTLNGRERFFMENEVKFDGQNASLKHKSGPSTKDLCLSFSLTNNPPAFNTIDWELELDGVLGVLKARLGVNAGSDNRTVLYGLNMSNAERNLLTVVLKVWRRRDISVSAWQIVEDLDIMLILNIPIVNLNSLSRIDSTFDSEKFSFGVEHSAPKMEGSIISLRVPLSLKNLDGRIKVRLPRSVGGYSLDAMLLDPNQIFDLDAETRPRSGLHAVDAKMQSSKALSLVGTLEKFGSVIGKVNMTAEIDQTDRMSLRTKMSLGSEELEGTMSGQWTSDTLDIVVAAQSSRSAGKHQIRAKVSKGSKMAEMEIVMPQLGFTVAVNGSLRQPALLHIRSEYMNEPLAEMKISSLSEASRFESSVIWKGVEKLRLDLNATATGDLSVNSSVGQAVAKWRIDGELAEVTSVFTAVCGRNGSLKATWTGGNHFVSDARRAPTTTMEGRATVSLNGEQVGVKLNVNPESQENRDWITLKVSPVAGSMKTGSMNIRVYPEGRRGLICDASLGAGSYGMEASLNDIRDMKLLINGPRLPKTGLVVGGDVKNLNIEYFCHGERIVTGNLEQTGDDWAAGKFHLSGNLRSRKAHQLSVRYNLQPSYLLDVNVDGSSSLRVETSEGRLMNLSTSFVTERLGHLGFVYADRFNEHMRTHDLSFSRNHQKIGYQITMKPIGEASIRFDMLERSMMLTLNGTGRSEKMAGRFAWDFGRDQTKMIELSITKQRTTEQDSIYEIEFSSPEQEKALSLRLRLRNLPNEQSLLAHLSSKGRVIAETYAHLKLSTERAPEIVFWTDILVGDTLQRFVACVASRRSITVYVPGLTVNAENQEGISWTMTARKSHRTFEADFGLRSYESVVEGRAYLKPTVWGDLKTVLGLTLSRLEQAESVWSVLESLEQEFRLIQRDFGAVQEILGGLYDMNALGVRTLTDASSKWVTSLKNLSTTFFDGFQRWTADITKRYERAYARYSERLSVVGTLVSAIYREIVGDATEYFEDQLQRLESTTFGSALVRIWRRYSFIVTEMASDYSPRNLFARSICGINAKENNPVCRIDWHLDPAAKNVGVFWRVPKSLSHWKNI